MKNGQLARAVCFQESADEGNADYIEGRLYQRFPGCFQALISKNQKSPCKGSPPYATILSTLGWPGFFKCEFSTCTDSVICDILIKHVNWPSAEERWNEV